ncbi:MAG: hypothetical protein ACXWVQ_02395 [Methyloceanibacter sp.]
MHVLCHLVEDGRIEFLGAESRRERHAGSEREKHGEEKQAAHWGIAL